MKNKQNLANQYARGHVQHSFAYDLLNGHTCTFRDYITTKNYYRRYIDSLMSVIGRMRADGYNIIITRGKHGGMWSATARIEQEQTA